MFAVLRKSAVGALLAAMLLPAALFAQQEQPPSVAEQPPETEPPPATEPPAREPPATELPAASDAAALAGADPALLAAVLEKLSAESRKKLGEMLSADWKDRPEWSDMLIDLLKADEMRPGFGWFKPSEKKYDWSWLSSRFDANSDGHISKDELPADAPYQELLFSRLDRDNDGQLRFADFDYFSPQAPTPPSMMSQFLSGLLDTDSNGRITPEELQSFLRRADKDKAGFLTAEDLYADFSRALANRGGGDDMPDAGEMLSMFFRGELGVMESGPKLGDEAPDFTLPTHDASQTIALSTSRNKPVILIFGSFT
jgi:Ca2+-binding EF-hand superfamily protein